MRKLFFLGLVLLLISYVACHAATIEGGVSKEGLNKIHKVLDVETHLPVPHAKVSLPKDNLTTYTDADGKFELNAKIRDNSVLAIEKEGYRPFSLTLSSSSNGKPLIVAIEKVKPFDFIINSDLFHLGDNAYSDTSANSSQFRTQSAGPYYSKTFKLSKSPLANTYLLIGSIIGLDTRLAKAMGQNRISSAYSSPAEVYFNGVKVSELHVNGDNQRVKLPPNLIRSGANEITIKTGRNMMEFAYIDYDDIEIMNLSIVSE